MSWKTLERTRSMSMRARWALLAGALSCALPGLASAVPVKHPEKLAIYYGIPEKVNNSAGNTTVAAAVFDDYDLVILGEGLELTSHGSHAATAEIIGKLPVTTKAYGYVDLCVANSVPGEYRCTNSTHSQLTARVDAWKLMGAKGIFLDQAGCDYGVTRQRQNDIVTYIHSVGLSAFINVWKQADAFSTVRADTTCNPGSGALTVALNSTDYTLLESWALVESEWSERRSLAVPSLRARAEAVLPYRTATGTKIAVTNTVAKSNPLFDQRQFDYTWWSSVLYGFDAMAWGESWVYSSEHDQLPFRTRPNPSLGDNNGSIQYNGDLHSRTTTTGTILLDTNGHSGRLTTKNVVTQAALRPTDLTAAGASFSATEVTFEINSDLAPIVKAQVFIDTDNNAATGYLHQDEGLTTVGADYMVDNDDLYVFTGVNQTTFTWQLVIGVTPTGFNTKQVRIPVTLSQIGYSSGSTLRMLAKSSTAAWQPLDFLPRSPAVAWTAKPSSFQQAGTQPGHLINGNVTFTATQFGAPLVTFSMDSNGGNIAAYRVMIDADNNTSTGVLFWGLGADYMVESGKLSRFVGATQSTWDWQGVAYNWEPGDGGIGSTHIQASYQPEHFGFGPGDQITVVMQNWIPTAPFTVLDDLPRGGFASWQVAYGATQQAESADTLVMGNATFSTNDITLTMNSNGGPIDSYRFFIDRDNNAATGYKHTAQGITGVGADYKIEDGDLYQFCGSTQTTICWTLISTSVTDSGYGTNQIIATFAKTLISYTGSPTIALVAENFVSTNESLDLLLVRSASTVWRASP